MKKMILVMLLIVLILFTSACKSADVSTKDNSLDTVSGSQITLMHFWTQSQIEEICSAFEEKNTDITIKTERINPEQYLSTLKTKIASNSCPDVFTGWVGMSMGWIYDLGVAKELSGKEFIKRLDKKTKNEITYKDKIYMLPVNKGFIAVGYNKKIFEQMGFSIPKSYAEFLNICKLSKKAGYLPLALGSRDSSGYILATWAMAVSEIYSFDKEMDKRLYAGETKLLNDSRWQKIIKRFDEWKTNGYIPENQLAVDRMTNCLYDFMNAKAAMFLLGSWDLKTIREMSVGKENQFELGLFPFPAQNPQNTGLIYATSEGLISASTPEYPIATEKFMDYLSTQGVNLKLNSAIGSISAFYDVNVKLDKAIDDLLPFMNSDKTWGYINSGWPSNVGNVFSSELSYYIGGSETLQGVLKKVDDEWGKNRNQ